ncbi:MAG: SUMF1/EgtB/PvdO family nonheme iron enzyme [Treponema sp.]|nr:SUMF1/EgtB/PvdO family nonheme iron enzyme [Treponema sp.]
MKKFVLILTASILSLGIFACDDGTNGTGTDPVFVAVTSITGVPTGGVKEEPLTLTGTVNPGNATNKTIVWSVKTPGTTGADISGNTLTTTNSGTVEVTATITNGIAEGTDFTDDFTITIHDVFVAVSDITGLPSAGKAGNLTLSGTVNPADATNKTIIWSVKSAGTTGATIEGSTLTTTAAGDAGITATIVNGLTMTSNFTKDFTITISIDPITITSPNVGELVRISAGTFTMGSPGNEPGRFGFDEGQHTVTLTKDFYMGKYEVTQAQYEAVMGTNPSYFRTNNIYPPEPPEIAPNRPVECVSWYDAIIFCNKLSEIEELSPVYSIGGKTDPDEWGDIPTSNIHPNYATWSAAIMLGGATGYRLPTQAEWEYACRAGTATAFNWGTNQITTDQANFNGTTNLYNGSPAGVYREKPTEVGSFEPNNWGLYDMHGNVWEWCWDWVQTFLGNATDPIGPVYPQDPITGEREKRGGSWGTDAVRLRSAARSDNTPNFDDWDNGFRLVRN